MDIASTLGLWPTSQLVAWESNLFTQKVSQKVVATVGHIHHKTGWPLLGVLSPRNVCCAPRPARVRSAPLPPATRSEAEAVGSGSGARSGAHSVLDTAGTVGGVARGGMVGDGMILLFVSVNPPKEL